MDIVCEFHRDGRPEELIASLARRAVQLGWHIEASGPTWLKGRTGSRVYGHVKFEVAAASAGSGTDVTARGEPGFQFGPLSREQQSFWNGVINGKLDQLFGIEAARESPVPESGGSAAVPATVVENWQKTLDRLDRREGIPIEGKLGLGDRDRIPPVSWTQQEQERLYEAWQDAASAADFLERATTAEDIPRNVRVVALARYLQEHDLPPEDRQPLATLLGELQRDLKHYGP